MIGCINTNSLEYQNLLSKSGIPEELLYNSCRYFLFKYGRFPHLDELRGVDSSSHLEKRFKIKHDGSSKISKILEETSSSSIEDAVVTLNDEYSDLEIDITPIVDNAIFSVQRRPTVDNSESIEIDYDNNPNSDLILTEGIYKLADLYGINIHTINSHELNSDEWLGKIDNPNLVKGFVYNGEIYINTDIATIDTPLHELMHLLIGNLRFKNPELYLNLINSVKNWSNYSELILNYTDRTLNDANEEIFISESAKFVLGLDSNLSKLDSKTQYEIRYNVKRLLDSILMGLDSVNSIPDLLLFTSSLNKVSQLVKSKATLNKFMEAYNAENSELHRKLNNIKKELIQDKSLLEECD